MLDTDAAPVTSKYETFWSEMVKSVCKCMFALACALLCHFERPEWNERGEVKVRKCLLPLPLCTKMP